MELPAETIPPGGSEFIDNDALKELEPIVDADGYVFGVICKCLETGLIGFVSSHYDLLGPITLQLILNRVKELKADDQGADNAVNGAGEGISDSSLQNSE